ncbi:MAG: DUF58 domain-containing protein [Defluviitaleaceae bacterium]|nr:DUF58 domain-containing protein [Defluviitaleaceae bacterium]
MVIIFMGVVIFGLIILQENIYGKLWNRKLTLDIEFSSKEAYEGDTLALFTKVTNKKPLPLPWLFVKYDLSHSLVFNNEQREQNANQQGELFGVKVQQTLRREREFVATKRGFYRIRNITMTANDLLHVKRFRATAKSHSELTVFPQLLPNTNHTDILYKNLDDVILSNSIINPDPFEFKGIREYQPTDSLRSVNFKASAVAGHMMVNIYAPTNAQRLEIILNLQPNTTTYAFEDREQAIRLAATVAHRYIHQGASVGLYSNGRDCFDGRETRVRSGSNPAHLYSILQSLAYVNLVNELTPIAPIAPFLEDLQDKEAVYLIISPYQGGDLTDALQGLSDRGIVYVEEGAVW